MINFASKIKEYRMKNFLTQDEFAKIIGVSFPCVTRWETGKYEPTLKIKRRLYNLFIDSGMKVED